MSKGEPQVQALVSGLYDVLNKIMVDVCISSCKSDERKHADELIQRLHKDTQTKNLIIIYKLRWGIETNYDCIKNKLCVENFSGVGKIAVLQDFYATVFLWNLTGIMAFDLHDEIESAHRSKHNKHEYRLNISMTISALKERVVELVMCENQRKSGRILRQICKALQKSVVAVNNDRTFPRHCKHRSLKFHNNAKAL